MNIPEGVERVRAKGRTYYYWNPGRKTERQGLRIRLPDPVSQPAAFFREIERLRGRRVEFPVGSVGDLVDRFRTNDEFLSLKPKTQRTYDVHLDRFSAVEAWGLLRVRDLTPPGVLAAREAIKATPVMANQMLAVGRTLWSWAIPLGYADDNPFAMVKYLKVKDRGHVPWPQWVFDIVVEKAWPDLSRMVRLGRMTCQRESDLVRMGPAQRQNNGLWCRPMKTSGRRLAFLVPLGTADTFEIDRWARTPLGEHHCEGLYLYSTRGTPYTPDSLRSRWGRWLKTDDGKALCQRWKAWLTECVEKYEWDIDPGEARGPTIHGLRGTGILVRHAEGYDVDQIANDVGMSRPMVAHYMRFKDQMAVAESGRARLKLIAGDGSGP